MSSDKFRRLYIYFVTCITFLSKKMNQDAFIKISHLNSAFLWTNSEYNQNNALYGSERFATASVVQKSFLSYLCGSELNVSE